MTADARWTGWRQPRAPWAACVTHPAIGGTARRAGNAGGASAGVPEGQFSLAMACVMLAMLLGALGQTIVATALPLIVADVGGLDRYVWVATAYMVAATAVAPIAGGLSDLYGRKPLFVAGLIVFIVSSALLGMSRSMDTIIAFRALQGIGGGLIMTCSLVAVADLIPPEQRGKYQGLLAGVYGVASMVGPVVGGVITEHFAWNGVFLLNVPVGLVVLLLILRAFPNARTENADRQLDVIGMAVLTLALVSLLVALSLGGTRYDWGSPESLGLLAFGLAMTVVFVFVESRAKRPIMPLTMYAHPTVALAMTMVFLTGFALFGCLLFLPLFFQGVLGVSAAASGHLLIPLLPAIVFGAILSGQLLSRAGERYHVQALCSTALTAAGMYLITTMSRATEILLIETYLVLTGLGLGATLSTITVAVQNSAPSAQVGTATAATQFWRSVGGMMGLAVAGTVMTSSFSSSLDAMASRDSVASLPQGWLELAKEHPSELLGPAAADPLKGGLAEAGPGGVHAGNALLGLFRSALSGALSDVFRVLFVAAGLSFGAALFFRVPGDVKNMRNGQARGGGDDAANR